MGIISVDSDGLAWLGRESERLAGAVVSATPAVSGGLSATLSAVRALHSGVDLAGKRIAGRLRSTGEAMSSAAHEFAATEAANDDLVQEVRPE